MNKLVIVLEQDESGAVVIDLPEGWDFDPDGDLSNVQKFGIMVLATMGVSEDADVAV